MKAGLYHELCLSNIPVTMRIQLGLILILCISCRSSKRLNVSNILLATVKVAVLLKKKITMQERMEIGQKYHNYMEGFIKTILLRKLLQSQKVSEETMPTEKTEERKKHWKYIKYILKSSLL